MSVGNQKVLHILCVCVCVCVCVALVIWHAQRMCHIILSSMACPALNFSHIITKGHDFGKKTILNIKCVFWFSLQRLSDSFLILRRIRRDTIINVHRLLRKVPFVRFSSNTNYTRQIFEEYSNIKFEGNTCSESRAIPWGWTDSMTKVIVASRTFVNATKIQ